MFKKRGRRDYFSRQRFWTGILRRGFLRHPALFFSFIAASAVLAFLAFNRVGNKAGTPGREKAAAPAFPSPAQPPPLAVRRITIVPGSTLAEILERQGLTAEESHQLRERVRPVYDLGKIIAGHEMRFYRTPDLELASIEYDIDEMRYLMITREDGSYGGAVKEYPFEIQIKFLWAGVEDNLIAAVNEAGENDVLALDLAEIFGWDIDFYTDIRKGDSFRILYEKKYISGKFAGYGNILAAEFINQGKAYQAFRFTYPDTKTSDYFDIEGNSLRKEFLRSPIKFARITSRFSSSRFHPIHKVYRAHYGVDYAAPIGTPVQATADGAVVQAGWNGGSGRMIKLRHKNAYETMYLHLRDFASGINAAAKVKAGQVIGHVGSSGDSTGPHLDYRVTFHGKYVNPRGWRFKPVEPLRPEFLEAYKLETAKYLAAFDAPRAIAIGILAASPF